MINIFEKLSDLTKSLNSPIKNYWEINNIQWDKNAKSPDGGTYNEQLMYESIKQSDRNRLLKYQ